MSNIRGFLTIASALTGVSLVSAFAQATISVDGGASYSISSSATAPFDNTANIIAKNTITATGPSTGGAVTANLLDDDITNSFPNTMWFNGGNGNVSATVHEVTFTFDSPVSLDGVKLDWAWNDRDNGTWEFFANGSSQGTFVVGDPPGFSANFPSHVPTHFLFDSTLTGVNTFALRVDKTGQSGNLLRPALAETTFYTAIPEPSTLLLTALGLIGLLGFARRRRRK